MKRIVQFLFLVSLASIGVAIGDEISPPYVGPEIEIAIGVIVVVTMNLFSQRISNDA